MSAPSAEQQVAVIIPCYRVKSYILQVLERIGPEVSVIVIVDDACPEETGKYVEAHAVDHRVHVLYNPVNRGVGASVKAGYLAAIQKDATILVKVDGDGQMDPGLIPALISPIVEGRADYCKGNRFFSLSSLEGMPAVRLFGNAILSFMTKLATGYWNIYDPTNGFTAVHADVCLSLPMNRIADRFFFESDFLFRLSTIQAAVVDVPMTGHYAGEKSNLSVMKSIFPFLAGNVRNFGKRIFYNYFLRGFSFASIALLFGTSLFVAGLVFATYIAIAAIDTNIPTATGTIIVAALLLLFGFQLILVFLSFDIAFVPRQAIHPTIKLLPKFPLQHYQKSHE